MKDNHFTNDFLVNLILDGKSNPIMDSLPVGVEIYDIKGKLLYMNQTDAKTFGIDRDTVITAGINIFDNPNLPLEVKEALLNLKEIHKRLPYHFSLANGYYDTHNNTKTIYIECNGRPIYNANGEAECYVFIIEDVTEDERKEQELRHSRLKMEIAIRDSGIMLWEYDVIRNEFYSDNEPMNAYDKSKPISFDQYIETLHPEDQIAIKDTIIQLTSGEDIAFSFDARILFPDIAEWQYCTVSGSPYEYDEAGRVTKYVGTRKNNTEIHKKELLQEKILDSIPLPIHIKDVEDNFRYVFCNEESERMFGTSIEKTTYDVMDAEQVARIEKTDKEVFATGEPYQGLERIVLRDGRSYDTIVRKSVIYDRGRRLILNVRWDQSLQNDLERRSKLLTLSLESMNAYSWFFVPGENHVSYGEGFERAGRDASKLNSLERFVAAIHPEDQQKFTDSIGATINNGGGEAVVEYRVDLNNSGTYEWWQSRGLYETTMRDDIPYNYMYGMSINIDAHKKIELTLLQNKEDLDTLVRQNEMVLNNTNSGLAYITTDYIVQWENVSICSKSLSHEAYKKGEHCYKSAHGHDTPCNNCVMQRAMKSGQLEQIQFKLDQNHMVEVFATPVYIDGKIDGIVIRVDDITERERIIEELRQAREQAEMSDKLKSAFLANMSHEIRTPLNAIVGFSDLLINDPDSEDKEEYIRIINNNNELLLKLINDILDLSKIEAGSVELKYEEFDLSDHFNGMAVSMQQRTQHNPNVRLIAINPHTACRVNLDKNRITQILTNYVTNAIKYTPKGFIEMGYESKEDGIRFYVRDSGIGIAEEKKDKVFHRFEKLDEFAQGTGLGLSICKAIAESMGGTVGFESKSGEGSLFWAFLPCKPEIEGDKTAKITDLSEKTEVSIEVVESKAPNSDKRYKVLIAEDIQSNYLLVSMLLKEQYDLIHAENGLKAVEMFKDTEPDLVLMDMKMPVMGGMEATEEIRKFNQNIPIVALTAHAFDTDRQAALSIGCNDYLVKPINKEQLTEILQKHLNLSNPLKSKQREG